MDGIDLPFDADDRFARIARSLEEAAEVGAGRCVDTVARS